MATSKARDGKGAGTALSEQRKRILTPGVKLERLYAEIAVDPALHHLRYQRKLVAGHGVIKPKVMVIVEMPEPNDERVGVAMTGSGGVVLGAMFAVADLKRASHSFITPVMKYRPPVNREGTLAELAVLLPYLTREIAIVDPQVIVTCGRWVNNLFFKDVNFADIRGTEQSWKGRKVLPTFAPMGVFHDQENRQSMVTTFRMLGDML